VSESIKGVSKQTKQTKKIPFNSDSQRIPVGKTIKPDNQSLEQDDSGFEEF
jgi:hypothetical protein